VRDGQPINDGTVLIPTGGRGLPCDLDCTTAFIIVTENGLLRGVVILHDEQERVQTPVPYPWAVFLGDPDKVYSGSADNAAVMDVELLGAWNGIAAIAAHRHYIARVQGQPLNIGVFVCDPSKSNLVYNQFSPFIHRGEAQTPRVNGAPPHPALTAHRIGFCSGAGTRPTTLDGLRTFTSIRGFHPRPPSFTTRRRMAAPS
jgi:hypothetical protein